MEEVKIKNWSDITLKEFYLIKDLLEETDEYTTFNLLDIIYKIDSSSMSLRDFNKYSKALDFLNNEVPTVDLKEQYTINGTTYNSGFNLSVVTAAQFIDYQNYVATNKWEDILSVFFIPEGHTYNDGYNIGKVKEDILSLDFPTVKSIGFFFTIQFIGLYYHFLLSFKKTVKKMKLTKEQKEEILNSIEIVELNNLELSQLF